MICGADHVFEGRGAGRGKFDESTAHRRLFQAQSEFVRVRLAARDDERRNAQYRKALAAVAPGRLVVDIGTGGEALLARMSVEAGARKVYAIEMMEESYRKAQLSVRRAGMQGQIEVVRGEAGAVELPERAEVCVSELIGTIGGSEGAARVLSEARQRLLRAEAEMVPRRCVTKVAGVGVPPEVLRAARWSGLGGYYAERIYEAMGERFDVRACVKGVDGGRR